MKHISIALIFSCALVTIVTGCSLFKSGTENTSTGTPISNNNGNIATYDKTDLAIAGMNEQLVVTLTPTDNAQAGVTYMVDLYEKGVYRASAIVEWNQPQLNVKLPADVYFPLNHEEHEAYWQCWVITTDCYLNGIFSVTVHQ
jgi:hypothetical protein